MLSKNRERLIFFALGFVVGLVVLAAGQKILNLAHIQWPQIHLEARKGFFAHKTFYLSFENDTDANFFRNTNGVSMQVAREHATDGAHALMVEIPGQGGYPGLEWEVFGSKTLSWKGKETFSLDVHNASDRTVQLEVRIKSGKDYPKKTFERIFPVSAGESKTLSIPVASIAKQIDVATISYIKFYLDKPKQSTRLYFDRITTEKGNFKPAPQAQLAPKVETALRRDKPQTKPLALKIYPDRVVRPINSLIYGSNLDPKTEFEMDVAKFGKDIGITNFRFPGGGSPGYHWQTGLSDFHKRINTAPLSKIDNLIEFLKRMGAKLVIQINLESGTPEEAAAWVKHMNQALGFRVDYWELGNEVYGKWDKAHMSGADYAKVIKKYSEAMKAIDPSIKIGADIGGPNYDEFNRAVFKGAADYFDFISYHWYPNHINPEKPYQNRAHPKAEEIMANSLAVSDIVNHMHQFIEQYAAHRKGKIEIAFMEWDGSWDAVSSDLDFSYKGMMWSLANAIFYADTLGQFARHGVSVGNQFTFQEVMFGLIRGWDKQAGWGGSRWDGELIRPKALAMKLFSKHFGDLLVESQLEGSPTYYKEKDWRADSYNGEVPYLDAYVSRFSNAGELAIVITNKHAQKDFPIKISLNGTKPDKRGLTWVLTGPSLETQNDGNPGTVDILKTELDISSTFTFTAPARSVSLIAINLEKKADEKQTAQAVSTNDLTEK